MVTQEEKRLFKLLNAYPETIFWEEVSKSITIDSESAEYISKAIELIPYGSEAHIGFMKAILRCYPESNFFHHSWLVRVLAAILMPDNAGNRITPLLIITFANGLKNKKNYLN